MLKIFLLVLIISLHTPVNLLGQQELADSVEALLKKELPDSNRAISMVYRAMYYESIDPAKSKQYYQEAIGYSLKNKLYYAAGLGLHYSIYLDLAAGKYREHLNDIESIVQYLSLSNSESAIAQLGLVMDTKASYFFREGNYDSASAWYLKSIASQEKIKKYDRLGTTYTNLAAVFQIMGLRDKQKEYILKGLEVALKNQELSGLTAAYSSLSDFYHGGNEFSTALSYSDSASAFFSGQMDISRKQYYFSVRAQAFEGIKRYDSAVFYYRRSLEIANDLENTWNQVEPILKIGSAYFKWKKYKEAEEFIRKGINLAEENQLLVFQKLGYDLLSQYFEETGNLRESLINHKKYDAVNDSLQNAERKKLVLDLDKKYETEKKEQQLKLQLVSIKQKSTLNYVFGGSIAGLLVISVLAFRNIQHKRSIQAQTIADLEKEKQLMSVQSLLKGQEEERNRLAKDLHDGLGGLLSGVKLQLGAMRGNLILSDEHAKTFNQALVKLDESINEMRRVAHNMMPEALIKLGLQQSLQDYCDGLSESQPFKINCEFHSLEKRLPSSTEIVVYRIVQELLNNAVKHSSATEILVQVIRQVNRLSITVEDNGKGFEMKESILNKGAGLQNILSRVDFLKGQIDIKSTPGKGSSIHIDCLTEEI